MSFTHPTRTVLHLLLICAFAALVSPSALAKGSFVVKPAGIWVVRTIQADLSANSQQSGGSSTFLHDSVPAAPLPAQRRGSTPETAIRVFSEMEIDELLSRFECRCGRRPYQSESPPVRERFRYDGEVLTGIRLRCQSCGQDSDLYINLAATRSEIVELGLNSVESTRQ